MPRNTCKHACVEQHVLLRVNRQKCTARKKLKETDAPLRACRVLRDLRLVSAQPVQSQDGGEARAHEGGGAGQAGACGEGHVSVCKCFICAHDACDGVVAMLPVV